MNYQIGLPTWTWPDWRNAPAGLRVRHVRSGRHATYLRPSKNPHNGALVSWDDVPGLRVEPIANVVSPARDLEPIRCSAWDLIGFDSSADTVGDEEIRRLIGPGTVQVRIRGGRALYEAVMYKDVTARTNAVKLARLAVGTNGGIREVSRYVDPDTELELIAS